MKENPLLIAPKGTVICDPDGQPTFELAEDIHQFTAVMASSFLKLPERVHPEIGTTIPTWVFEWAEKRVEENQLRA